MRKISVIIPAYHEEEHLRAVQTARAFNYEDAMTSEGQETLDKAWAMCSKVFGKYSSSW